MKNKRIIIKDPDKLKCVKTGIKKIIKDDNYKYVIDRLTDVASRTNKLVILTYQFIRLYLLDKFSKNEELPIITSDFIKMVFLVLTNDTKKYKKMVERNPSQDIPINIRYKSVHINNIPILESLVKFYDKYAQNIGMHEKIDGKHLSQILSYIVTSILTSIENHIKENYVNHIKFYVNRIYLSSLSRKTNKELYDTVKKELYVVKNDIINYTLKADKKYHIFIKNFRGNLIPQELKYKSLMEEVVKKPQSFLIYMIRMSNSLENLKLKQQQIFPLRNSCIIKYIPIDTKTIIELLCDGNKKDYLDNLSKYKDDIWSRYFNIDKSVFRKKDHYFKHMIYTDCVGVSILFEHNSYKEKTQIKNENKRLGRIKQKQEQKGMTKEEIKQAKINRDNKKEDERNRKRKLKEEQKAAYNALSKDEKKKLREKNQLKQKLNKIIEKKLFSLLSKDEQLKKIHEEELRKRRKQSEFPYLDELTNKQLEELVNKNKVYVDPGKIRLYTMVGKSLNKGPIICNHQIKENQNCNRCCKKAFNNLQFFKYSISQRIHETKRLKYQRKLEKKIIRTKIHELENNLCGFNSKTCKVNLFVKYLKQKNKLNSLLFKKYNNPFFRRYKWYSYINKQRSEQKLVDNIKKLYGSNCAIIMGDWSISKQMRNFISTPMIGLKRRLSKHFDIINLDEYNTSKINNITKTKCENLAVKLFDRKTHKKVFKSIHSVLTYKMENNRLGCINRDINAVLNMKELAEYWFAHNKRHPAFSRKKLKS